MNKTSYKVFAIATIPFFAVDYYYTRTNVLSPFGGLVDGTGNAIIVAACLWGASMDEELD